MRISLRILLASACFAAASAAQAPIVVTVDTRTAGATIPADFLGLSFESSNLLPEPNGRHLFGPANRPLIALFRALGVRSLRLGGGTADMPRYRVPGEQDIDELFAFAAAADVKVIYTLRVPAADVERNTAIAKYIDQHYRSQLTCLEIGNEPDYYRRIYRDIPDYATYRGLWTKIAATIRKAIPGAKFCGPATGGVTAWSRSFAEHFGGSGFVAAVAQHEYPGGDGGLVSGATARDAMLSRAWLEQYDRLYNSFATTAISHGLPYRLEETNNYTGGARDASDAFPSALWALEYLHWWAARGASGLNFHNRRWILNTTIYPVKTENDGVDSGYRLHPIGYGLKAFDLGGHGTVVPLTMSNPEAVNLTAYAVRDGRNLLVTLINKKDPGTDPRDARVSVVAPGARSPAAVVTLSAPSVDAKDGITLGGASLGDAPWDGKWAPLAQDDTGGYSVIVPGVSAAIIKLTLETEK